MESLFGLRLSLQPFTRIEFVFHSDPLRLSCRPAKFSKSFENFEILILSQNFEILSIFTHLKTVESIRNNSPASRIDRGSVAYHRSWSAHHHPRSASSASTQPNRATIIVMKSLHPIPPPMLTKPDFAKLIINSYTLIREKKFQFSVLVSAVPRATSLVIHFSEILHDYYVIQWHYQSSRSNYIMYGGQEVVSDIQPFNPELR
ncbi:hypothetical protein LXL04_008123 [Taraxacum kok-saghyz]